MGHSEARGLIKTDGGKNNNQRKKNGAVCVCVWSFGGRQMINGAAAAAATRGPEAEPGGTSRRPVGGQMEELMHEQENMQYFMRQQTVTLPPARGRIYCVLKLKVSII